MTIDPQGFPLDLTGENPRNLVVNDTRTIASVDDSVFVPDGGPFYTRTLTIHSGSKTLIPNVDYKCLHLLRDASVESGLDVSAIVMITNTSISNITMRYQVIGGTYAETVPVVRQLLENADNIEKSISWNTHIYAKPDLFEPAPHFVSGDDFSDWSSVLNGLSAIERALNLKDVAAWESAFQYIDNLITQRIGVIDLSNFYTKSDVNAEVVKLALKTTVYTKVESNARHYSKTEVDSLIGDIDGNEAYYTEGEINAKFIETTVADAKFATKAEVNRVDSAKADKSSVYTRTQTDDRYPLAITVYNKDYIDATFVIKGTGYTKSETEARYALKTDAYNKVDSDKRYALKSQIVSAPDLSKFISRDDADALYLKINNADVVYLRKTTADSLYAKHTDLEIIDTLNKKFNNYYTRVETDEKFITLASVNSLFLTKVQGNSLYYTKSYSTTTFASKVELTNQVKTLTAHTNTKADKSYLDTNFYDSAQTDIKFYNKVESEQRYTTKSYITSAHYTKTEMTNILNSYAIGSVVNTSIANINKELDARYTKNEIAVLVYTKSQSNALFLPIISFNNEVTRIDNYIATRAATTWVENSFYNKNDIDKNHYTKSMADNLYYNKATADSRFHGIAAFNTAIRSYATTASLSTLDSKVIALTNDRYKKSETYSKSEADSRYLNSSAQILQVVGAGTSTYTTGVQLHNNHSTSVVGSSLVWNIRNDRVMLLYTQLDSATNAYRAITYLKDVENNTFTTQHIVSTTGIWTRAYGNLHDYFARRTDLYTKAETYSKAESDVRYYDKAYTDKNFVSQSSFNTTTTAQNKDIALRAEKTWVTSTYLSKVDAGNTYYSKKEIVAGYYTKVASDARYATITSLNLEVSKLVKLTAFNSTVSTINAGLADRHTKAQTLAAFGTKAEVNAKASIADVAKLFTQKVELIGSHYTQAQSNARFALKAAPDTVYDQLYPLIVKLQARSEPYKVGDIYVTTINFSSEAAVAAHHGYGSWTRYAAGRSLIGYSPNAWVDGYVNYANEDGLRDTRLGFMGVKMGFLTATLTVPNLPAHNHSNAPYNKFVSRSSDTGNLSPDGSDWRKMETEIGVTGISNAQWYQATEKAIGGGTAHNNTHPSIVVGMWLRFK